MFLSTLAPARKKSKPRRAQVAPPARPRARGKDITPLSLLLPYQQRWVEDDARFKIGVWSRQTGKSFCTAAEAVLHARNYAGSKWVCLSAGERQSLEWLEKAKEWIQALDVAVETFSEEREQGESLLKSSEVRFVNGSRIVAIPANPATARGYSANIILDEFAYHENPDAIWAAMFPSQTNPLAGTFAARVDALQTGSDTAAIKRNMKLRIVSTFNGRGNKFFSLWERREQNHYHGHFVDVHTAIKEGLALDLEALKAGLDDPEIWAQEYECVPMDASAVLLPYELLAACETPEATTTISPEFFTGPRHYVVGIDFGRTQNLTVAWTNEIFGDVAHTREVLELRDMSTPDQVELLRPRLRRAARVCLDNNGAGIGLGDYLVQEFGKYDPGHDQYGKIELCPVHHPMKLEIFSKLKMAFEQRALRIPVCRTVREDLHSVQRVTTDHGSITYRAPHTKDGHADRCTALALAVRADSQRGTIMGIHTFPDTRLSRIVASCYDRSVDG
jgi:phage FluMu gp28-like protein